ncbi:hypothetical protein K6Y73_40655, partial [Burkholderia cenocepacia]
DFTSLTVTSDDRVPAFVTGPAKRIDLQISQPRQNGRAQSFEISVIRDALKTVGYRVSGHGEVKLEKLPRLVLFIRG